MKIVFPLRQHYLYIMLSYQTNLQSCLKLYLECRKISVFLIFWQQLIWVTRSAFRNMFCIPLITHIALPWSHNSCLKWYAFAFGLSGKWFEKIGSLYIKTPISKDVGMANQVRMCIYTLWSRILLLSVSTSLNVSDWPLHVIRKLTHNFGYDTVHTAVYNFDFVACFKPSSFCTNAIPEEKKLDRESTSKYFLHFYHMLDYNQPS